jgi:L-ascorbate metabolism protein UlaG (beta-lactamase superfamily)
MEVQFFGANCVRISSKKASIVVDDNMEKLSLKPVIKDDDIALYTLADHSNSNARFMIDGPGEYEISEVSILGIPAQSHIDSSGKNSTMYSVRMDGFSVGILGHIDANLSDEQLEALGLIDVLFIPVGGSGYTLDAIDAAKLVKKIEPKIVIPTHYADSAITFEVPQNEIKLFLDTMGVSGIEEKDKIKFKISELGDKTETVVLKRS